MLAQQSTTVLQVDGLALSFQTRSLSLAVALSSLSLDGEKYLAASKASTAGLRSLLNFVLK